MPELECDHPDEALSVTDMIRCSACGGEWPATQPEGLTAALDWATLDPYPVPPV